MRLTQFTHKISSLATVLIIFAVCSINVSAQTHYVPHISIGGRAGVTMSEVSFAPTAKQTWNKGTTGAVTFRYVEEKLFGLIAELGWTQRGWQEDFEDSPCQYSRTLTYLQMPLLTHIYFGSPRVKCFINMGPEFSYMIADNISSNFDYRNPTAAEGFPTKARMTEQMAMEISNKFDYGITAGLGVEFYVNPRNSVSLEGRFYYGLGNIFPAAKADTFSASRNMTIEITAGYFFRLK